MPVLPRLPAAARCPDQDCQVPIGVEHLPGCETAICVSTGHQRIRPLDGPRRPFTDLGGDLVDAHVCGDDEWTGVLAGAAEAAAAGLFVYRANGTGPWIPCPPGTLGAVPDLTRVMQSGTWDPIRQRWLVPEEATSHA
jgi:hypothetical protein